jgi:hypothetical protein
VFGEFGEVNSVHLPTDSESGKPSRFGYVEFTDADGAKVAMEVRMVRRLKGVKCAWIIRSLGIVMAVDA